MRPGFDSRTRRNIFHFRLLISFTCTNLVESQKQNTSKKEQEINFNMITVHGTMTRWTWSSTEIMYTCMVYMHTCTTCIHVSVDLGVACLHRTIIISIDFVTLRNREIMHFTSVRPWVKLSTHTYIINYLHLFVCNSFLSWIRITELVKIQVWFSDSSPISSVKYSRLEMKSPEKTRF